MTRAIPLVALVLLGACATAEQRQARLMDEMEMRVELPATALQLESYGRFYAPYPGGRVIGTYIDPREFDAGLALCLRRPGRNRDCTTIGYDTIRAGERRWQTGEPRFIRVFDHRGCRLIWVIYNPASRTIESVTCDAFF